MDKIKIYSADLLSSVEMPKVKTIQVDAEEVSKKVTMASGKTVKDIIGYRTVIQASWDYVPAATVAALISLVREGDYLFVEYPAPEGDASSMFEVSYPALSVFRFKNGTAVWHDVSLKMTAQEVS